MAESQKIEMPLNSIILDVQFQGPKLVLWAIVHPEDTKETITFLIFGTGQELDYASSYDLYNHARYLKTVQQGSLVWHIFSKRTRNE